MTTATRCGRRADRSGDTGAGGGENDHDSDFNPAADRQAQDRCHRMGQTRPVRVIRLVCGDTVDERIIAIDSK